MHLKNDSVDHPSITGLLTVIDGIITKKQMAHLFNERLLPTPSGFRFKALATADGYFKSLDSFDADSVLKVFKVDDEEGHTPSGSGSGSDHGYSSDSDEHSNTATFDYSVLEKGVSTHIEQYHNVMFDQRATLPLWRGHILHFVHLNKTVFYLKCHHAICDGMSLAKTFLSLADNFESVDELTSERILNAKSYQRYQRRWDRPLIYIAFLAFNAVLWFIEFLFMLCVHVEVDSVIRPPTQSASKTYAVLMDIDLAAIDEARKGPPFEERRVTVNDFMDDHHRGSVALCGEQRWTVRTAQRGQYH